ncbi:aminoglycoside N(3)-acetyltransferase [Streptomyces finlayi]|uniref:Aminoglycoside N(3)-acetyltransferase n=1 Tax=Streptomyces finlayi TaxID=67296 RepID=A0A7G7BTD1_9ACTN|nr:AAC(3) family N-acetyltransferase [Streptomyces finlayi]QNE78596.1 aminoglycoside N(3)-acetyltransferase [Streptomyces finlayi]
MAAVSGVLSGERAAAQLRELGVPLGGTLLVHASMRSVGAVDGGVRTMVAALLRALGPDGTLVVPAFTPENSDTSPAFRRSVHGLGEEAREAVRAAMPPFDRAATPAPSVGRLAEAVRLAPGAERSGHPQTSFAALGPAACALMARHRADCHYGEDSPLAALYGGDAHILLLGTGFDTCTAFHLAEYRVARPPRRRYRCVVTTGGRRGWWEYEDVDLDDSDFAALGRDFEESDSTGAVRTGLVGAAHSRLVRLVAAVDFAAGWFAEHRGERPADPAKAVRT